jgi:glycosyltransferase involved in cell wall biosynthesis
MTYSAIHQFLPSLARGDAIGLHALRLRDHLRAAGLRAELFADEVHPSARGDAHPYERYGDFIPDDGRAALLYHASTGSPMADFLRAQPWPLLVDYHNITEARFFERWEPLAAQRAREAREQLARLAPHTALAVAHSRYSEHELRAYGFAFTDVVPLLLDFHELDVAADEAVTRRLARQRERDRGGARWLFVSRVAPNKCHHDVIAAFAVYRQLIDPRARLTFVGGMMSQRYRRALDDLAAQLDVTAAVHFTDRVTEAEKIAYYRAADVFVCLSEHEGFMVPIVEAMHLGIPVVAYDSTAVPETVGDAGLLIKRKDPVFVAAAVERVLNDGEVRATLVGAGKARAASFSAEHVGPQLLDRLLAAEVAAGDA